MLICSIGAVNAADLDDNSTVEVSSDVDDSISVDDALINDNVEQSQDVASTNAATWDELKTACQSSGDKVITLTGQSYNANSQIVFGNSATIVGILIVISQRVIIHLETIPLLTVLKLLVQIII